MEHSVWTWLFFHIHGQLIPSSKPVPRQTLSCLLTSSAICQNNCSPSPYVGKQAITPQFEMCGTYLVLKPWLFHGQSVIKTVLLSIWLLDFFFQFGVNFLLPQYINISHGVMSTTISNICNSLCSDARVSKRLSGTSSGPGLVLLLR